MPSPEDLTPLSGGVEAGPVGVASAEPPSSCLRAWIPLEPPSMNRLTAPIWHQKRLVPLQEVTTFRYQFKCYLPKWCLVSTGPYLLHIKFYDQWYYLNGYPKKKDVGNLMKACEDALCERYGFDDALIWRRVGEKVQQPDRVGIDLTLQAYA